jgi:hypothetical protein
MEESLYFRVRSTCVQNLALGKRLRQGMEGLKIA